MTANLMFAQIINIPDDYPTIQQGINAASDGDTVLVQPGLYVENLVMKDITLASLFLTTGDTSYVSQTIIDGGQEGSVISYEQVFPIGFEFEVMGFTIQNGLAEWNSSGYESGGGVFIWEWTPPTQPSNIVLSNLIIKNNVAHHKGSGIHIGCWDPSTSYVYIKDVVIQHNGGAGDKGTGIYCENIDPILEDVVIKENFSCGGQHAGVGGYFYQSSPRLQNVSVISNHVFYKTNEPPVKSMKVELGRDALVFDHSSPLLQNVLITDNRGAGIYLKNSEAIIHNSTLTFHSEFALECKSSSVILINSILWGNGYYTNWSYTDIQVFLDLSTCSVLYCDMQEGIDGIYHSQYNCAINWLEGNINADPVFDSLSEYPYQLAAGSPCIDAGTPDTTGLNLPYGDIIGQKRIWDGDGNGSEIIDMGAYEFGAMPVGIEKKHIRSSEYNVRTYPNPFSEDCFIEFELAKPSRVSIQIYNNMGELLTESKNQVYLSGQHKVQLNLIDLKEGIYFCRIQVGNEMVTKKIIKVR